MNLMNTNWTAPILCLALTACGTLSDLAMGITQAIVVRTDPETGPAEGEGTDQEESRSVAPDPGNRQPPASGPVRSPRPASQGPNLGATILRRLPSGSLVRGERYQIRMRVRNHGDRPAPATHAALTFHQDGRRPILLDEEAIPALRPGQGVELLFEVVLPNSGPILLAIEVDPRRGLKESDHARGDNLIEFRRTVVARRPRAAG